MKVRIKDIEIECTLDEFEEIVARGIIETNVKPEEFNDPPIDKQRKLTSKDLEKLLVKDKKPYEEKKPVPPPMQVVAVYGCMQPQYDTVPLYGCRTNQKAEDWSTLTAKQNADGTIRVSELTAEDMNKLLNTDKVVTATSEGKECQSTQS